MGKVREETTAKSSGSSKTAAKSGASRSIAGRVLPFFINLLKTEVYKPTQGKNARLWTGVGLGLIIASGLYQLLVQHLKGEYTNATAYSIVTGLALAFGWVTWRILQYPPFADFLIATEAEMNKVSWTSPDDLKRATIVVLVTVVVMAAYLFGVDFLWSALLKAINVLKFSSEGLGSQAG